MANLTGAPLVPGTHTGWDYNVYKRRFDGATYDWMKLIPVVEEANRLYNQLTVRKAARLSGVALSPTADGSDLNFQNPLGTSITVTPVHTVVPIAWGPNFQAQLDFQVSPAMADELESALGETTEANVMANFQTATQFLSGATVDAAMLRQGMARITTNTNSMYGINGKGGPIYGFFSSTQLPALQGITEVNNAQMRGDKETPYVRGIWVNGFGFVLNISTVVPQDANGWHNALLAATGLVTSWNMRSNIEETQEQLAKTAIAHNNMGSNVQHDARIFVLRTTADAS